MKPYVILETAGDNQRSFYFDDFEDILIFRKGDDVGAFFARIEEYQLKGYWLAGYFDYEFSGFLDPVLKVKQRSKDHVYAWFGVCRLPGRLKEKVRCGADVFSVREFNDEIAYSEYLSSIEKIRQYLLCGDTYQVNYTFGRRFVFYEDVRNFYNCLSMSQPTEYMALIDTGDKQIVSFSPELFFKTSGRQISVRPMKGTLRRGFTSEEDNRKKALLVNSEKDRAENLMIVDLLRNDLGRVCKKVETLSLFDVEKYRTVFQMTSTVRGELKSGVPLKDIFAALFPCGSVTGAPKIRTMEIIEELEKEPRGVYTGAVGYFAPEGEMCFSVAIRTVEIENNTARVCVGGGIVIDSEAEKEYAEACLKSDFINRNFQDFLLIETILWDPQKGFYLKEEHKQRMADSAGYFDYPFDEKKMEEILVEASAGQSYALRVRVLLDKLGGFTVETVPLKQEKLNKIKISEEKVDSGNVFLYHKTTNRNFYQTQLRKARQEGYLDIVFTNEKGEITEGCVSNIFIEENGVLYTPPVVCGLLPGTMRGSLLKEGRARERKLVIDDVKAAEGIFLSNSVRGLVKVFL